MNRSRSRLLAFAVAASTGCNVIIGLHAGHHGDGAGGATAVTQTVASGGSPATSASGAAGGGFGGTAASATGTATSSTGGTGGAPPIPPIQLALGEYHSCVRKPDGTVWCWGGNNYGQLGNGVQDNNAHPTPMQVTGLGMSAAHLAHGARHVCARKQDGTLWCWGFNVAGQLGDGTTGDQYSPVQVAMLGKSVDMIASGGRHTCALKLDSTLWCWGANQYGQLGDGTTVGHPLPAQVTQLGASVGAVALSQDSIGNDHTCALKVDGTLWCWGSNQSGQLGEGTTTAHSSPMQVAPPGASAAEVAAAASNTCTRKSEGTLWCWGSNGVGLLGLGTSDNNSHAAPVQVSAFGASVAEVALGGSHACALKLDGSLWCWGTNQYGQLGDGTTMSQFSPVQVTALGTSTVGFALGLDHSCASKLDGTVWCWGGNVKGQLGLGSADNGSHPIPAKVNL